MGLLATAFPGWDDAVYSQAEPKLNLKGQTSPGEVGICHNAELNERRPLSVCSRVFAVKTQALLNECMYVCEVTMACGAGWTAAGTTISFTAPWKGGSFEDIISPSPVPSLFPWVDSGLVKMSVATTLYPQGWLSSLKEQLRPKGLLLPAAGCHKDS